MNLNLIKFAIVAFCFSTLACETVSKINGPDGTPHLLIRCQFIQNCYQDASKACGGKYAIVNTSNEVSGTVQSTTSTTNLLVKCQ